MKKLLLILSLAVISEAKVPVAVAKQKKKLVFRQEKVSQLLITKDMQKQMEAFKKRLEQAQQKFMQGLQEKAQQLEKQVVTLSRRKIAEQALNQSRLILTKDLTQEVHR